MSLDDYVVSNDGGKCVSLWCATTPDFFIYENMNLGNHHGVDMGSAMRKIKRYLELGTEHGLWNKPVRIYSDEEADYHCPSFFQPDEVLHAVIFNKTYTLKIEVRELERGLAYVNRYCVSVFFGSNPAIFGLVDGLSTQDIIMRSKNFPTLEDAEAYVDMQFDKYAPFFKEEKPVLDLTEVRNSSSYLFGRVSPVKDYDFFVSRLGYTVLEDRKLKERTSVAEKRLNNLIRGIRGQ